MSKRSSLDEDYESNKRRKSIRDKDILDESVLVGSAESKAKLRKIEELLTKINEKLPVDQVVDSEWILKKLVNIMTQAKSPTDVDHCISDITGYFKDHEEIYWNNGNSSMIKTQTAKLSWRVIPDIKQELIEEIEGKSISTLATLCDCRHRSQRFPRRCSQNQVRLRSLKLLDGQPPKNVRELSFVFALGIGKVYRSYYIIPHSWPFNKSSFKIFRPLVKSQKLCVSPGSYANLWGTYFGRRMVVV